jgi:chromosome segregation ATPase
MTDMYELARQRDALLAQLATLNDELAEIDERRAAIKGQIEQAQATRQATGVYADSDWFRRANGALRHLGVERNEVAREIGEGNRSLRALNNQLHRDSFHNAVRDVVDEETYRQIIERARELDALYASSALAGKAV